MAYEIISVSSFSRVIRAGDSSRFGINLKKKRQEILEAAATEALTSPPVLSPFASTKIRGRSCLSYQRYNDNLVMRAISNHLRRRLRISTIERNAAIEGIIQGLTDGTPMHVLRRDIKDFYESIDYRVLRDRLLFDPLVTPRVRGYLRHFFDQHCPPASLGIPRGIGLSALLAELHMQEFDRNVRNIPGVYRYYRFADDIFVFSQAPPDRVAPVLEASLPNGMTFNSDKSMDETLDGNGSKTLEYLGYQFSVAAPRKDGSGRSLSVTMSKKKISRLKSRIIVSAKAYSRDGDYTLLYDRIRFIASNYEVRRLNQRAIASSTHVRSGIYYNYRYCGQYTVNKSGNIQHTEWDATDLRAMDGFMMSVLFGGSSKLKAKIASKMPANQQQAIRRLSFFHGFRSKILIRMQPHRISDVKSVWRNV